MHVLDRFIIVPFPKLHEEERRYIPKQQQETKPFKAVYKSRPGLAKKFYAVTKENGKLKNVGYFYTKEEALKALESYLQVSSV